MSEAAVAMDLEILASDASGQRKFKTTVARSATCGDVIDVLVKKMGLRAKDSNGRPLDYQAFSKRESRHLRSSETIGESLQAGDEIAVLPDVQAG